LSGASGRVETMEGRCVFRGRSGPAVGVVVASGVAGVPRRADAVQGGGPWIAVLAGQAGGIPGPPQPRCA